MSNTGAQDGIGHSVVYREVDVQFWHRQLSHWRVRADIELINVLLNRLTRRVVSERVRQRTSALRSVVVFGGFEHVRALAFRQLSDCLLVGETCRTVFSLCKPVGRRWVSCHEQPDEEYGAGCCSASKGHPPILARVPLAVAHALTR